MGKQVWTIGLAAVWVGFLFCAGCSQQEPVATPGAETKPQAEVRAEAAGSVVPAEQPDAVVPAADEIQRPKRDRLADLQDPAVLQRIESGDPHAKLSIKRARPADREAYEKARARATVQ